MSDDILYQEKGPIAELILNRPEKRNAFHAEMIQQIVLSLEQCSHNAAIRGLVISAEGDHFCAGGDIEWMRQSATLSPEENLKDARQLARLMHTLFHLNKPTLAQVSGSVFGGGLGLVACSDTAIGLDNSVFCLSEVKLGLVPAVIGPFIVSAMGRRLAQHYMLTGQRFTASEALAGHLLHECVPTAAALSSAKEKWCEHILEAGPSAVLQSKRFAHQVDNATIDAQMLDISAQVIAKVRTSDEAQEGTQAFLEKRTARWVLS